MVEIAKDIRVELYRWKGHKFVSIRRWYTDKDGVIRPSQKGINFRLNEWKELIEKIDVIKAEIEKEAIE